MSGTPTVGDARRTGGWRLAEQRSVYLQGAKEQAIDWYPWGTEAFEVARRARRPVLLDIGAVWCHWCHVMDEGTYSDAEVARLLHQSFVAVKVDRDENPEIDRRYQRQVGALTGEGGWPLTAFLTPEGDVFFGGTYFPAQDGLGRPGFRRVLKEVARWWKEEPERVREHVRQIREGENRMRSPPAAGPASSAVFTQAVRASLYDSYDPIHGGFGMAPKFPHPTAVSFLLWESFASGSESSAHRARDTLQKMADGGIYDHLGGGFHRYSVDEGWHIPHFEKMGSDNAALLSAYVETARRFPEAGFDPTIRGTVAWLRETLEQPGGGFGSSQDADNAPGDDGGYYTWSRSELKAALDAEEFRLITRVYGVGSDGRMPHDPDRNVLFRLMGLAEAAEGQDLGGREPQAIVDRAIGKLQRVRRDRPAPVVDPAIYAHLNGGFVRALAAASQWLEEPELERAARRAVDRFLVHGFAPDRGVAHRLDQDGAHGFGLLEDQAEFAWGLVELAGATVEPKYLDAAESLLHLIEREFVGDSGLLRDIAPRLYDGPTIGSVTEPSYPLEDNPHLSANAAAALAFLRFSSLTGRPEGSERARRIVDAMRPRIGHAGLFAAGAAWAAGLLDTPPARVVVEGKGEGARAMLRAARRSWHPNLWVFEGVPPEPFSSPEELRSASGRDGSRALICFGSHCLAPVVDPDAIGRLLLSGGRPPP